MLTSIDGTMVVAGRGGIKIRTIIGVVRF